MSQPIASALATLPFELVYDDGEPLESEWHVLQNGLLRELILLVMEEQGRPDFYVGGNMFVYYSVEQAREVASGRSHPRGPDVFWIEGIKDRHPRNCWVSWEEGGRLPDVILEMLSPSTASNDRNEKKDIYEQVFHTSEYFLYEPDTGKLEGFRLAGQAYRRMLPNGQGRLWSERLGVFVGLWHGIVDRREYDWVRLYRPDGTLVPTQKEQTEAERQRAEAERQNAEAANQRADAERQRAEAERQQAEAANHRAEVERQRADAAEAELLRLRALLEGRGQA
ncbi:MAG TPA: Uma2 family endonuclease [Thermoanaerobaculia bacterium]|jgi:Uma2 family endonuclease